MTSSVPEKYFRVRMSTHEWMKDYGFKEEAPNEWTAWVAIL